MKKPNLAYTYCIFMAFFVASLVSSTQGFMLTSFINQYSLDGASQGALGSAQNFGSIISLAIAFIIAGRMKKTTVVTLSLVVIILMCAFISFIPPFVMLMLIYGMLGIVIGLLNSINSSFISDLHPPDTAPKYMNFLHGVFGVGGLCAPLFFLLLMQSGLRWNEVFIGICILLILIFAIYYFISKKAIPNLTLPKEAHTKFSWINLKIYFKSKTNILLCLSIAMYASHQMVVFMFITRYITDVLMNVSLGALALSLFWVGTATARLTISRVKLSNKKIIVIGNILAAICLTIGVVSNDALILTICVFLTGLFGGAAMPLQFAMANSNNPKTTLMASTIMSGCIFVFQTATPVLIAYIAGISSLYTGLITGSVLAVACALVSFFIREKEITGA